jgi:hypothetical protein
VTGIVDSAEAEGVRVEVVDHRVLRVTLADRSRRGRRPSATASATAPPRRGEVTVVEVPRPRSTSPGRGARHHLRAHRRRGRRRRARQRRAPDASRSRSRPTSSRNRGRAPLRDRRPAAVLRARGGGGVRRDLPVEASDGQFATANVHLSVRAADPETNSAPVPQTVTARVIAGETVRIPIPLGGADPDGDSVQLLGQESSPELGAVVSRGGDWLEYEAGEYSAGTDTFQYACSTRSARARPAPSASGSRPGSTAHDRRSRWRTRSRCGPGARSRCGCSRTTPTPTAARSRCARSRRTARCDRHRRGRHRAGRGARPRGRLRLHLRGRERGPRHSVELPHGLRARRRPSPGPRHPTRCSR